MDKETILIDVSSLKENMLDLEGLNRVPLWSDATKRMGHDRRMPNPDRALAQGLPIYSAFIDVFGDDVSGNRSKSWNKHWNIYITNRNLPRKLLQQQSHIHFISTSTHASVPEQFHGIKESIELVFCLAFTHFLIMFQSHTYKADPNTMCCEWSRNMP